MSAQPRNLYKVPAKPWRKWSGAARGIFNAVYDFSLSNQSLLKHPKAELQKPAHWKTMAWNSAWIAADAADKTLPTIVVDIDTKTGKHLREAKVQKTA